MGGFELVVETQEHDHLIRFRLNDAHGSHLAAAQVQIGEADLALWQGVFDTRTYVGRYAGSLLRPGDGHPVTAEQLESEFELSAVW
jgi:hypothetical protein